MIRYKVTISVGSVSDIIVDAENEWEAEQKAIQQVKDRLPEDTLQDTEIIADVVEEIIE